MPPKKASSSKKTYKSSVAKLTTELSPMTVKATHCQAIYYSLNWTFPFQMCSVVEGSKEIVNVDFLCANLPKNYVKVSKVLKGYWQQLAFLMAVPKWFYEEDYSKKQMCN